MRVIFEISFEVYSLREKCPYSEFFKSVFFRFGLNTERNAYLSVFRPNAEKHGREKTKSSMLDETKFLDLPLMTEKIDLGFVL